MAEKQSMMSVECGFLDCRLNPAAELNKEGGTVDLLCSRKPKGFTKKVNNSTVEIVKQPVIYAFFFHIAFIWVTIDPPFFCR